MRKRPLEKKQLIEGLLGRGNFSAARIGRHFNLSTKKVTMIAKKIGARPYGKRISKIRRKIIAGEVSSGSPLKAVAKKWGTTGPTAGAISDSLGKKKFSRAREVLALRRMFATHSEDERAARWRELLAQEEQAITMIGNIKKTGKQGKSRETRALLDELLNEQGRIEMEKEALWPLLPSSVQKGYALETVNMLAENAERIMRE